MVVGMATPAGRATSTISTSAIGMAVIGWHGEYGSRLGWWWIVGPDWYWYPAPVYPYPDPYLPPGAVAGFWYWCDFYHQYYPFVGACPSGWRAVPAQ